MLLTKRKLLIGIAISETLNSKQFYELFQKLNDDVSLDHPFVLGDVKFSLPEETSKWLETFDWLASFEKMKVEKVKVLTILDAAYPRRLKEIYLPPIVLFYKGEMSLLNERLVALVGSREHSNYAKQCTKTIVQDLVQKKIGIISGLAKGVDSLAHRECLKNNGKTIAVIGSGLDVVYPPENANLYKEIGEKGLIISEYPLGSRPLKFHFPYRNRIIAGLSHGVCVIEAKERSGSLITANIALSENREVFAIPGSIFSSHSKGTNQLIEAGACLVSSAETIDKNLHYFP